MLYAGADRQVTIEVLTQLDAHTVRGIALNPKQGLARGMCIETDGKPLSVPVGKEIISRMFDVFGKTINLRTNVDYPPLKLKPGLVAHAL